jgi:SAM-dependent methyltransferase
METFLTRLRAAAEPTRLRLLALCASAELTVSEVTQILSQSQPRVSRHLKLLCDAGLLNRNREGTWAFYRLATGDAGNLARSLINQIPDDDPVLVRDLNRLGAVKKQRAEAAAEYFRQNAGRWSEIRALHVAEEEVEQALLDCFTGNPIKNYLDIGTGTGRLLELLGPKAENAVGVDLSHEMLNVARTSLEQAGLENCQVRLADMYDLPFDQGSHDAITLYQVLHYADDPAAALAEASRVLRQNGRLVVIDFAPHNEEALRADHAHRRLGFSDDEVRIWFKETGLKPELPVKLNGDPLSVVLWSGVKN